MGLIAAALAMLAGCDLFAYPGEQPVAAGSIRAVASAANAARRCGVRDTRLDPLDRRRAVLRMGSNHPAEAEACLRAWLSNRAGRFDAALLEQVRAG